MGHDQVAGAVEIGSTALKMAVAGESEAARGLGADSEAAIDLLDARFPTSGEARALTIDLADRIAVHAPSSNARLVAQVTLRLPPERSATLVAGHLVRIGSSRSSDMRYLLLAQEPGACDGVQFSTEESVVIERSISQRRRGRGGLGRGQGRKSVDGVAYPRRVTITLAQMEVGELLRLGAGNVCAGIRELARRVELDGRGDVPQIEGSPVARRHFVARLDARAEAVLRSAGDGQITRGISWSLAARRPKAASAAQPEMAPHAECGD